MRLACNTEHGTTDVRVEAGAPFRPKAWPRSAVDSAAWCWRIISGWSWNSQSHINSLEVRATTASFKWRLRSASGFSTRFFHGIDSLVALAVLSKGRTSARALQPAVNECSAITLVGDLYPIFGYFLSQDNPSDVPSRWADHAKASQTKA